VVNPRSQEEDTTRYSMPFFVHPYPNCVLETLPVTATGTHLPPITADAFLQQRLREIGLIK
jgi:isopenicillin N synthase-like dioxygenase